MIRVQTIERRVMVALLAAVLGVTMSINTFSRGAPTDTNGAVAQQSTETKEQRDDRMAWWHAARFGMFIHWGVYSVPAGTYDGKQIGGIGEWIMNNASIPVARYAEYTKDFNPTKFNAEEWVSIAKNAGMKYIVITSKHHDGFAMFHSKVDGYNIYDATPFKRDPLAELAEACQKQGIKLGFYYSQAQDWHHAGGAAIRKDNRKTDHWDPAQDGSFDDYLKSVALPQVREILTNYGPVAVLWFDTPTDNMTPERAAPFVSLLHELQPQIIVNNRLGGGFKGDTETPEQFIPPGGFPGRDWETCMTINGTWGYKSYDTNFKSVERLLTNLIDIASKGGNYLLNVGPTSEGVIPQPEVDRLQAIGQWLKVNGESIYDTTGTPFRRPVEFGRVTQKPGKLFLHVFDWPADGKLWMPLTSKVTKAYLLAAPDKTFDVSMSQSGTTITLTGDAPDKIASVVVAELDGPPQTFAPPIRPNAFALDATDADLAGGAKMSQTKRGHKQFVTLANDDDTATFPIDVKKPGSYQAELTYSTSPNTGSEYTLSAAEQKLSGKVDATKSSDDFATVTVGNLSLDKTGEVKVTVQPAAGSSINLRALKLTPQ
jgi:alpha-L-fucosidase